MLLSFWGLILYIVREMKINPKAETQLYASMNKLYQGMYLRDGKNIRQAAYVINSSPMKSNNFLQAAVTASYQ